MNPQIRFVVSLTFGHPSSIFSRGERMIDPWGEREKEGPPAAFSETGKYYPIHLSPGNILFTPPPADL